MRIVESSDGHQAPNQPFAVAGDDTHREDGSERGHDASQGRRMHDRSMADVSILSPDARRFAAAARTATLATVTPSGRPRLVPICFIVGRDAPDGRPRLYSPIDEKPKRSADPHELARVQDLLVLPDATLLVDRWDEDWTRLAWLRLDCRGEILEPEPHERDEHAAAVASLREKYPQYVGQAIESRPVLRFTVDRAVSWGDLAG
jgi:PPOX class probable F420-dependent enzyme